MDITRVWSEYHRRNDFDKEFKALRLDLSNQDRAQHGRGRPATKGDQQLAMGTPERLALEEKRKAAMKDAEDFRRKSQEELNEHFVSMLNQLFDDVIREIEAAAKEGNYDMVLKDQSPEAKSPIRERPPPIGQRVVLYSKPEYDLTAQSSSG